MSKRALPLSGSGLELAGVGRRLSVRLHRVGGVTAARVDVQPRASFASARVTTARDAGHRAWIYKALGGLGLGSLRELPQDSQHA